MRKTIIDLLNDVDAKGFWEYGTDCRTGETGGHDMTAEDIADYLLENGVTVQRWIPVAERLPEDDLVIDSKVKLIKVLGFYKTSMGVPVVRTQIRQKGRRYNRDRWTWAKPDPITHWMPLPEPPKGE